MDHSIIWRTVFKTEIPYGDLNCAYVNNKDELAFKTIIVDNKIYYVKKSTSIKSDAIYIHDENLTNSKITKIILIQYELPVLKKVSVDIIDYNKEIIKDEFIKIFLNTASKYPIYDGKKMYLQTTKGVYDISDIKGIYNMEQNKNNFIINTFGKIGIINKDTKIKLTSFKYKILKYRKILDRPVIFITVVPIVPQEPNNGIYKILNTLITSKLNEKTKTIYIGYEFEIDLNQTGSKLKKNIFKVKVNDVNDESENKTKNLYTIASWLVRYEITNEHATLFKLYDHAIIPKSITFSVIDGSNKICDEKHVKESIKKVNTNIIAVGDTISIYVENKKYILKIDKINNLDKKDIVAQLKHELIEYKYEKNYINDIYILNKKDIENKQILEEITYDVKITDKNALSSLFKMDYVINETELINFVATCETIVIASDTIYKYSSYTITIPKFKTNKITEKELKDTICVCHIDKNKTKLIFKYEDSIKIEKKEELKKEVNELNIKDIKVLHEKIEAMGLGGMEEYIKKIVKEVLAFRTVLCDESIRKIMKPSRGILLYGPPGTGKTTLARTLASLLGCEGNRLIMKTSTELLSKWFGESEQFIREMFGPAREAYKKYGDKSPLYMIVIDEIDAILSSRQGSDMSRTRDSLVNQFLGALDGLEQMNNLIVIGMTNCLHILDKAAIRAGRFGCKIEIGLPNLEQRQKIFDVYINKLKESKIFHPKINTHILARATENMSGADIENIITNVVNEIIDKKINETYDEKVTIKTKNILEIIKTLYGSEKKEIKKEQQQVYYFPQMFSDELQIKE